MVRTVSLWGIKESSILFTGEGREPFTLLLLFFPNNLILSEGEACIFFHLQCQPYFSPQTPTINKPNLGVPGLCAGGGGGGDT